MIKYSHTTNVTLECTILKSCHSPVYLFAIRNGRMLERNSSNLLMIQALVISDYRNDRGIDDQREVDTGNSVSTIKTKVNKRIIIIIIKI